mmetsp:Transcript_31926/g.73762  ORF Transcript_31926/g.73762 Transcript_31926/m.73762 type:complete len:292 (+) Transcript_31926:220-1095(+)
MSKRGRTLALLVAAVAVSSAERTCNTRAEQKCIQEYEECRQTGLAESSVTECECATELYGLCLRKAGCAADRMTECVSRLMGENCEDMSVCGSNCVGQGDHLIDMDTARVLPVNNFGENYLQFSVCHQGPNSHRLSKFSQVSMERCDESSFHVCPYWIPPNTFTALAISANASYIRMERCVYVDYNEDAPTPSPTESGTADDSSGDDNFVAECLKEPKPVEYYGTRTLWPSFIDVEYAGAMYCESDEQCRGSYCDTNHVPPKCAPKATKHFDVGENAGRDYLDPTFFQDEL